MAMKKTSGGDSPLRQGAGKSFWTLPISGRQRRRIVMCFWKSDRVFRFFSPGGIYRRKGSIKGGASWPHHRVARPGPGPRPLGVSLARAPLRLLFGILEASVNIRRFGFCFVQFREYFLCNFSKTQKQQKIGNWHCGISLIG
jgi:hypothetical protein